MDFKNKMARKFIETASPHEIVDGVSEPLAKKAEELYQEAAEVSSFLSGTGREDRREFQGPIDTFLHGIRTAQRGLMGRPSQLTSMMKILRKLELGEDGKCQVCGASTYKDAACLIGNASWADPRSFHESGCFLAKIFRDFREEARLDEKADEVLFEPTRRKILEKAVRRAREMMSKTEDDAVCSDHE